MAQNPEHVKQLEDIASAKGQTRPLTFGVPHVFKALQLLQQDRFVSRNSFCGALHLGEGAVKTMIRRLKARGLADSIRSGTYLTPDGTVLAKSLAAVISCEVPVKSAILGDLHGHAVLVRGCASLVRTGIEQRDFAIMYGASVVLTLVFCNGSFSFPGEQTGTLELHAGLHRTLGSLGPQEGDVVIIASGPDPFAAELAAKNSALRTLA